MENIRDTVNKVQVSLVESIDDQTELLRCACGGKQAGAKKMVAGIRDEHELV